MGIQDETLSGPFTSLSISKMGEILGALLVDPLPLSIMLSRITPRAVGILLTVGQSLNALIRDAARRVSQLVFASPINYPAPPRH
jgi:hypothetical protein